MDNQELVRLCTHIVDRSWPAYLCTIDKEGSPQIRALFNLRNRDHFPALSPLFDGQGNGLYTIFTTNTSSSKVREAKANPRAAAYYCIPEESRGLMLGGEVEIVDDLDLKRSIWQDGWERYYPQGHDDPDHTVLRLHPRTAKGWNQSSTFELVIDED